MATDERITIAISGMESAIASFVRMRIVLNTGVLLSPCRGQSPN